MSPAAAITAVVLATLVVAWATPMSYGAQDTAALRSALQRLQARDLDGRVWNLERLQGRVILVDFWASWCAPCLREIPYMKATRARAGRENFEIVGINLDTFNEQRLVTWLDQHNIDWPQVHQQRGFHDDLPRLFGVGKLPTSFLLDRQGRVRGVDLRGAKLTRMVQELVAESPSAETPQANDLRLKRPSR